MLQPFPHLFFIKASTAELDTTTGYEGGEEIDTHTSRMMHWKDVKDDVAVGESAAVPVVACALTGASTTALVTASAIAHRSPRVRVVRFKGSPK